MPRVIAAAAFLVLAVAAARAEEPVPLELAYERAPVTDGHPAEIRIVAPEGFEIAGALLFHTNHAPFRSDPMQCSDEFDVRAPVGPGGAFRYRVTRSLAGQTAYFFVAAVSTSGLLGISEVQRLQFVAPHVRVSEGLLVLYCFDGRGDLVRDTSGVAPPLDLRIEDRDAIERLPGALRIHEPTSVSTLTSDRIVDACRDSNALTLEAWIRPRDLTQSGPARVVGLSNGLRDRNFTLGQGRWGTEPTDLFDVRVRTSQTDGNGVPELTSPAGSARPGLQHVVYTRSAAGQSSLYVDAALVASAFIGGSFANWDRGHALILGNEVGGDRPWLGTYHLVAVYGRALSPAEVAQNHSAGTGDPPSGLIEVDQGDYLATGPVGGPVAPPAITYTIRNAGSLPFLWQATADAPWVTLTPAAGSTPAGEPSDVTVRLEPEGLAAGNHRAEVAFVDLTDGGSELRSVRLSLWSGDRPGPQNTGPDRPEALVPYTGSPVIDRDGTVIEDTIIRSHLTIQAHDVTIRNFVIDGGGRANYGIEIVPGFRGHVFERGEIRGIASAGILGGDFTATGLLIHESGSDGLKVRGNALVQGCWIHSIGTRPGAHADANQTRVGSNITFRGCFLDIPVNAGPPYKSNACSINQTGLGPISNMRFEGNWVNGGNYTFYFVDDGVGHGAPTGCQLIDNRFGRDYRYGVLRNDSPDLVVSGNVWDDTGELMDINNR